MRDRTVWLIVLVALVGLCYTHGLYDSPVFDDSFLIVDNPTLGSFSRVPDILGFGRTTPTHRVIRNLSYALDALVWGKDLRGFHLTNLFLHLINATLVLSLGWLVLPEGPWAFLAALLWAVHPVQTDSVTYLSGRRDLLSTLFFLLGFRLYLAWRERLTWPRSLAILGAYLLGCFSKEMAVTLPAIIVAWEVRLAASCHGWATERLRASAVALVARARSFWFGLVALPVLFTAYVLEFHRDNIGYDPRVVSAVLPTDAGSIARYGLHYLKLLVFPRDLSIDYSPLSLAPSPGWLDPTTLGACGVLALLAVALLHSTVRRPSAAFCGWWFVLCFLPVSNLFMSVNEAVAEHYLYLPSVGCWWAVGALLAALEGRISRRALVAAGLVAALALGIRTDLRNRDWDSPETIYHASLAVFPRCARMWSNLAGHHFGREEWDLSLEAIDRAIAVAARPVPVFHANRARALAKLGRHEEAVGAYEKALGGSPRDRDLTAEMGDSLLSAGHAREALAMFRAARGSPVPPRRFTVAWLDRRIGICHRKLGDLSAARRVLAGMLVTDPADPETLWQLALVALDEAGKAGADGRARALDEARRLLDSALAIAPESALLWADRARIEREAGRPEEVLACYERMGRANGAYLGEARRLAARFRMGRNERAEAARLYGEARSLGLRDRELEAYLGAR